MGLFSRLTKRFASKKQQNGREESASSLLSRTSTIQSRTQDLVCQRSLSPYIGSRDLGAVPSRPSAVAANWGCIEYDNGSEYLGWTLEGRRDGPGKIHNGEMVYDGQWQCDLPHGSGLFANGDETIYEGNWENGLPHGHGVALFPDGFTYVGEWSDGVPCGEGKLVADEGRVYSGTFSNGLPNGEGVLVTYNGVRVMCHFDDGVPFGLGEIEWPNGMRYVGTIIEGLPHGLGRLTDESSVTLGLWKCGVLETRLKAHEALPDALRDDPAVSYLASH
ncbi:MORN repeat containing protein, putative [Babesia bigemina]|uniref:MORN repeat containing protein, putative n=1 Tax=Babesia bigemina TaxID=5866 RepID=A0A061D2J9_BABBI|nr:MORN repeat containing protein, putative [Babesia bigemina]CDR94813.1 MORN repeat containing protein, putative [Babesia bigemina]|eukprot:XP_012766999.1 MORN repeat containing protein, putative [Babesia bigemina]